MKTFRNVLVGIDIDGEGRLADGSRSAIQQALLLAEKTQAALTFAHVIDIPEKVREVMSAQPQSPAVKRIRQVESVLEKLAADAEGLQVRTRTLFGFHWRGLINEVHAEGHDLVIIGTRSRRLTERALFGSTGNRLLRYCPCTVWSVKPMEADRFRNVLVAHDLSNAGQLALQIGAGVAHLQGASLSVLHVLEHPESRSFLGQITNEEIEQRRDSSRSEIESQCKDLGVDDRVSISVVDGEAYTEILHHVSDNDIDLLCMGTIARSGLAGFFTGNTAEQVLPWVFCSLIAVKPEGFASPMLGK